MPPESLTSSAQTPSEVWEAMSDPEKNIWLLKAFFAPKAKPYCLGEGKRDLATTHMWYWIPSGKPRRTHDIDSRPIPDFLKDWNHTMRIAEGLQKKFGYVAFSFWDNGDATFSHSTHPGGNCISHQVQPRNDLKANICFSAFLAFHSLHQ